ncbi:hypothetical protein CBM2586_A10175 [Cupriavidus phytorum]|uniref:Uncharacterized protein n=1 Tax=Cupriavidus taiwanensis TaxID=164546 RepID=A0A375B9D3_9BURK|nr:hypothetical protein CBM2586_A10175 [Cupriavidus taiwanensis]
MNLVSTGLWESAPRLSRFIGEEARTGPGAGFFVSDAGRSGPDCGRLCQTPQRNKVW